MELGLELAHELGPVEGDVEVGGAVVDLVDLAGGGLAVVEHAPRRLVQRLPEVLGPLVPGQLPEPLERDGCRQVLAEGVPPQMRLLEELLDVLGRGAAGACLKQPPAREQRHDREHLRRGPELQDGEQVRQVVAQHVASDGDGVLAGLGALAREAHGVHRRHDLHRQPRRVVQRQVLLHLVDDLPVVRAHGVEPEDRRVASGAGAADGELDPVLDGRVLGLAHPPDVALSHLVLEIDLARGVGDLHSTGLGDHEGLVVGAVLLSLLRHQPHVRHVAHGSDVELAVLLAEVDHLLVHGGVAAVGDDALGVLQLVLLVPHLARVTHNARHRGVHDHVRGDVEVGDPEVRVDHSEPRALLVHLLDVSEDSLLLGLRGLLDPLVHVAQPVVLVHAKLLEERTVLLKDRLVEDGHAVAKHDRVRNLHHRRLEMEGEEDVLLLRILHLLLEELAQFGHAHARGIEHLLVLQLHLRLQHRRRAVAPDQLDLDRARALHGGRLLRLVEVPLLHVRDMRLGSGAPGAHLVGVLLGVCLHRRRHPAVRVALPQHRVHSGSQHLGIQLLVRDFLGRLGVLDIERHVVALLAKLGNAFMQLRHRRADVGQLDDVGLRRLRDFSELR
mmetsp:Transcript_57240/g.134767  ORF Transcript_57240/g.134767 Transcript_57240/m.134767 type:complete len:614 (-) Transcript_57240:306-2147(-)